MLRICVDAQGQTARHQIHPMLARHLPQTGLHRSIAKRFGNGQFVGVLATQQTEIFGQHRQLSALRRRLFHQRLSLRQVVVPVAGRHHLQQRRSHGVAGAGVSTFTTLGSFQEPCTRNSWVLDLMRGRRKKYWAKKLVMPTTGLMAE